MHLLRSINATRQSQLTPRAKKLYHVGLQMKRLCRKLLCQNTHFRKKLALTHELLQKENSFPEVNSFTNNFISSQLRLQKRSKKGRRFNTDDKILALSVYKRGPKTYKLLRKIFALPSRKTLMQLLQRIPFDSGINEAVMESLKQAISKEKPLDRRDLLIMPSSLCYGGLNGAGSNLYVTTLFILGWPLQRLKRN